MAGLRARRPGATNTGAAAPQEAAPQYQAPPAQEAQYQAPPQPQYQAPQEAAPQYQAPPAQEAQYQAPPQQQYQTPPQQQYQQPAPQYSAPPAAPGAMPAVANLNAGVLENIEDLTGGGNYVTLDGESFLYKDTNETAPSIDMIVSAGKRYYQWVDESDPNNKVYHDSPTKLDNRYKLKFEIRWFEEVDGEPTEYIMSLGTTSAIQFINYIQALSKQGKGVGNVVTRMTISRHNKKDSTERYSRVDFAYVSDAQ